MVANKEGTTSKVSGNGPGDQGPTDNNVGGGADGGGAPGNGGSCSTKPSDNNSNDGGNNATRSSDTPQAGYLPNGMQYSIPFHDKLISLGLTSANVKWLFQEDILTPDDFATFLNQAAFIRMLSSNNYGLNKLSVVKQQKFRAFHKWLWQQKAQEFDLSDTDILDSCNAKALTTILANEGSNGMMHECDGYVMDMTRA